MFIQSTRIACFALVMSIAICLFALWNAIVTPKRSLIAIQILLGLIIIGIVNKTPDSLWPYDLRDEKAKKKMQVDWWKSV